MLISVLPLSADMNMKAVSLLYSEKLIKHNPTNI